MSAPGKRFETPTRFVLVDDSLDSGWAHVHDTTLLDPCVASFAPAYRDRAEQMVESLNIHELAEQLRNAPGAPGFRRLELSTVTEKTQARINDAVTRAAGAVEHWTGQPPHGVPLRASSAAFPNTASGILQPLPRPELFDEPEPGGSMPAYQPRGDEQLAKLSDGGRVHEFLFISDEFAGAGRVLCKPCNWSVEADLFPDAREAFEQHVEATARLDAQLNRAPRIVRNASCPHGDEERCSCPKWIPAPGGDA